MNYIQQVVLGYYEEMSLCLVSDLTHFPEIMDGRVKHYTPAVHGGILADRNKPQHLNELSENI